MRVWRIIIEVADAEAEHDEFSEHDLLDTLKQLEEEQELKASTVEIKEVKVLMAA